MKLAIDKGAPIMNSPNDDKKLGLGQRITRRDFMNGTLLASGAALLGPLTPLQILAERSRSGAESTGGDWDGYGGVGDYKNSHGNPLEVVQAAHRIRDGAFDGPGAPETKDTGEVYDLAIVGGGAAGLGAAYFFQKGKKTQQKCLILENHPIFGGESKQNEFLVNGQRLMGPQGAWRMDLPSTPGGWLNELYQDIRIDRSKFHYQSWDPKFKKLEFDRGCDFQILEPPNIPSFGYLFDEKSHGVPARWVRDLWGGNLDQSPYSTEVKRALQECVFGDRKPAGKESLKGEDLDRWLDSITYQDYLEHYLGLPPDVTRFVRPLTGCLIGLGPDAVSALWASRPGLPGFRGIRPNHVVKNYEEYQSGVHAFPGGNTNSIRHLVKFLIPDSITGQPTLEDIHNQNIHFDKLDLPENSTRIRLNATVIRVEHLGKPDSSEYVQLTYLKDGELRKLRARAVVMASGTWVNARVVRDIPEEKLAAYREILHSSMLVVNVAVTNWRFLYKLGLTGGRWFDGFGYFCNLRQQMRIGDYQPKLDPDSPNVLTFYANPSMAAPGKPAQEQVMIGRNKLFSTSFQDYERQIRETLTRAFSMSGFNPKKDISGIILNRWGHSVIVALPGLMFGRDGRPSPLEGAKKPFGRIAFAHSELEGAQYFSGALIHARRAVQELSTAL